MIEIHSERQFQTWFPRNPKNLVLFLEYFEYWLMSIVKHRLMQIIWLKNFESKFNFWLRLIFFRSKFWIFWFLRNQIWNQPIVYYFFQHDVWSLNRKEKPTYWFKFIDSNAKATTFSNQFIIRTGFPVAVLASWLVI